METIYTGACSAALNGNAGVPAVSFRTPCVSSQLVLLFLLFFFFLPPPPLFFFPLPPCLSLFSGADWDKLHKCKEGSFAICDPLSSLPLARPLRRELHEISVFYFVLEIPCGACSAL